MQTPFQSNAEVAHFVHGRVFQGDGRRTQAIFNPATGIESRNVRLADKSDVEAAVRSAMSVFPKWADTPPIRRARVMLKFLELINLHKDELAAIITAEHGKVFSMPTHSSPPLSLRAMGFTASSAKSGLFKSKR